MSYAYELTEIVPASPDDIYRAWMSSDEHGAMTGGSATIDPRVGGDFEAWDGYITGRTLALEPGRRIVQSWRTSEFAESDPDSEIEVLLEPVEAGTRLTLRHRNVPADQPDYEHDGWQENYFDPMKEYFSNR
jgi:activator of HSP90 ATPase